MYTDLIRKYNQTHDPRHIEAWMRVEYGTLDGLTTAQFAAEVAIAAEFCDGNLEESEALAQSFGL